MIIPIKTPTYTYEFHISRRARQQYQFEEVLFALDGSALLADFAAARRFAARMSAVRGQTVPAGEISAMGLIDEILHLLIRSYEREHPGIIRRALDHLGPKAEPVLEKFNDDFPPQAVLRGQLSSRSYLDLETAGRPNRQPTLEELLLLHVSNGNPALEPYQELFDDSSLRQATPYDAVLKDLKSFFAKEPGLGSGKESLYDILLAPALHSPLSLQGQLESLAALVGN